MSTVALVPVVPAAPAAALPSPARAASWSRRAAVPALLLIAGAGLGAGGMVAFGPGPHSATGPAASNNDKEPEAEANTVTFPQSKWEAAGIKTEAVAEAPLQDHVWRTGRVVVDEDRVAHVSPPVDGVVVEVRARLGQDVAAGAVLAVLESREVGQAKMELVTTRVALMAERERAVWATTTAANTIDLVKAVAAGTPAAEIDAAFKDRPVGERRQALMAAYAQRGHLRTHLDAQRATSAAVPAATLQKTEAEFAAAEAALKALCEEYKFQAAQQARQAELKLKEAAAALDAARSRLLTLGFTAAQVEAMDPVAEGAAVSRFELKAPFAGTVVEKHAVRSERVGPQTQMFQVADLSTVWVQADAYEADLPLLRALAASGTGLVFRAPNAGVPERPADVVYAGDIVDRSSRALLVTAATKNDGRALKPGMYVEVGLPRGTADPVLQVPATVVQRHEGKVFVFVHAKGDEFRRVEVELGREAGDRAEVRAGLKAGDRVVTEGGFVLKSELLRDQLQGE